MLVVKLGIKSLTSVCYCVFLLLFLIISPMPNVNTWSIMPLAPLALCTLLSALLHLLHSAIIVSVISPATSLSIKHYFFLGVALIEIIVSQLPNKMGFSVSLVHGDRLYSVGGDLYWIVNPPSYSAQAFT